MEKQNLLSEKEFFKKNKQTILKNNKSIFIMQFVWIILFLLEIFVIICAVYYSEEIRLVQMILNLIIPIIFFIINIFTLKNKSSTILFTYENFLYDIKILEKILEMQEKTRDLIQETSNCDDYKEKLKDNKIDILETKEKLSIVENSINNLKEKYIFEK